MRVVPLITLLVLFCLWQPAPAGEAPAPVVTTPLVQTTIEPTPDRQFFEPGTYLTEGAIIHGIIPDAIILRRADRLARSEVTIVCGKVTVQATADRSSQDDLISLTLQRVVMETASGKKEVPLSGFAMGIGSPKPGVPCRITDDLLVTEQKTPVLLILTGSIQVPE
jgi:hypothetical protein